MAKKNENRVSVNKFETAMKENFENAVGAQWNGLDLSIKKTISLGDMMTFVDEAVENSFLEDGTYAPELTDFIIRCNVVGRYAGFALPSDVSMKYRLVYETDAFDFVLSFINAGQYNAIIDAINMRIRHELNAEIRDAKNRLTAAAAAFEAMEKQTKEIFGELTEDDVRVMLDVVSAGIDEEKVAKAVLEKQSGDNIIEI